MPDLRGRTPADRTGRPPLSRLFLPGKKIVVRGAENFFREGPNIIVGNHCGSFKDVAVVYRIVPRPVFFTANQQIFNRDELDSLVRKHLKRHLKELRRSPRFGPQAPSNSCSSASSLRTIARVGTIPVDLYDQKENARRSNAVRTIYRTGRALIALQGRGRVDAAGSESLC